MVFFLSTNVPKHQKIRLNLIKTDFYSGQIFNSFEELVETLDEYDRSITDRFELQSARMKIAHISKRGPGNILLIHKNFNILYYQGNVKYDAPLVVENETGRILVNEDYKKRMKKVKIESDNINLDAEYLDVKVIEI